MFFRIRFGLIGILGAALALALAPAARAFNAVPDAMPTGSETVLASGLEFLIVDDKGQILVDHPFVPA